VIVIDRLLVGSLKFVLGKIVDAANAERSDEGALREELLAAQMRHELGEIDDAELDSLERAILAQLREIKAARGEVTTPGTGTGTGIRDSYRVVGIEASALGDEDDGEGR
jgi:hypothetical protein